MSSGLSYANATILCSGGAVLACPCGRHAHGDARASLEVTPATSSRYGRFIAHGYAPGCLFFTERGQVIDAFGVFCRLEQLTPAEAVRRLARGREAARSGEPPAQQAGGGPSQAPPVEQYALGAEGGRP